MEWAMESHSKDYWSFWATWLQVVFGQWNPMELVWNWLVDSLVDDVVCT